MLTHTRGGGGGDSNSVECLFSINPPTVHGDVAHGGARDLGLLVHVHDPVVAPRGGHPGAAGVLQRARLGIGPRLVESSFSHILDSSAETGSLQCGFRPGEIANGAGRQGLTLVRLMDKLTPPSVSHYVYYAYCVELKNSGRV